MELVVPEGEQTFPRMAGHQKAQRMGVVQETLLVIQRKLGQTR